MCGLALAVDAVHRQCQPTHKNSCAPLRGAKIYGRAYHKSTTGRKVEMHIFLRDIGPFCGSMLYSQKEKDGILQILCDIVVTTSGLKGQ